MDPVEKWLRSNEFHSVLGQYMKGREADALQQELVSAYQKEFPLVGTVTHKWERSTLGHGELMCTKCKITVLEARALGEENECRG